jgi:hypothetical protein
MAQTQPFVWGGGGQQLTYEQTKKRREVADALAAKGETPQTFGAGLNRIGEALLAKSYGDQASASETAGAESRKSVIEALLANSDPTMADIGGALGNDWVANDAGSSAVVQALLGQELQQNDPLRQQQLQMGQIELDNARNPQPEPGFSMVPPDEVELLGLPPGAYQRGPDGKIVDIGGGGQTINVGGNNDIGTIPAGMMVTRDAAGNVTGMKPIPGGPAEAEILAAQDAQAADTAQATTYADIVTEDIDRALGILETDPTWTTGPLGQLMGNLKGSSADRLDNLLTTVRANTSFDRLQAMRDASPTGGALGSVTENELKLLQDSIGSLERSNPDDLAYNLKRVQQIYNEIINGKGAGAPGTSPAAPPPVGTVEDGYRFKGGNPADPNSWEQVQSQIQVPF